MGPSGPPGYCDQNSCVGYNVGVQLPSNVFQNYGEETLGEEDDPYRYYQPNYPAPQPVQPQDELLQAGRRRRSTTRQEETLRRGPAGN